MSATRKMSLGVSRKAGSKSSSKPRDRTPGRSGLSPTASLGRFHAQAHEQPLEQRRGRDGRAAEEHSNCSPKEPPKEQQSAQWSRRKHDGSGGLVPAFPTALQTIGKTPASLRGRDRELQTARGANGQFSRPQKEDFDLITWRVASLAFALSPGR